MKLSIFLLCLLIYPVTGFAERIALEGGNEQLIYHFDVPPGYACYRPDGSDTSGIFGYVKESRRKSDIFIAWSEKKSARKLKSLSRIVLRLEKKVARASKRKSASSRYGLRNEIKLENSKTLLGQWQNAIDLCGKPVAVVITPTPTPNEPEATVRSEPTATPTSSPEPTATATPDAAGTQFPTPTPTAAPPTLERHYRHASFAAHIVHRAPLNEAEARWIAEHYDLFTGQIGNYSHFMHSISHIRQVWMRSTRALTDIASFEVWLSDKWQDYGPTYEMARESAFLNYRRDTEIVTGTVPGWREECSPNCNPAATAQNITQSRVPDVSGDGNEDGWWIPDPFSEAYLDYEAYAFHQRRQWYGDSADGILWDWCTGHCVSGHNKLNSTHQYEGVPDDNCFEHPFIGDSVGKFAEVNRRFRTQYPSDSEYSILLCNAVSPYWTYEHPELNNNDYRDALLASPVDQLFYEMGAYFNPNGTPSSSSPSNDVTLKYLKDLVQLSQVKQIGFEFVAAGDVPDARTKIYLLGLAYLFQHPDRFMLTFRYDGLPNNHVRDWMWIDAMEYDLGLPATNPSGVRDVFGQFNSSQFYQFASGQNPNGRGGYHLYARTYENGLVLVKLRDAANATWGTDTETTHALNGSYRELYADGTLGPVISSIKLRNSQSAILIAQ